MLALAVTAHGSDEKPAVLLDQPDDIADLRRHLLQSEFVESNTRSSRAGDCVVSTAGHPRSRLAAAIATFIASSIAAQPALRNAPLIRVRTNVDISAGVTRTSRSARLRTPRSTRPGTPNRNRTNAVVGIRQVVPQFNQRVIPRVTAQLSRRVIRQLILRLNQRLNRQVRCRLSPLVTRYFSRHLNRKLTRQFTARLTCRVTRQVTGDITRGVTRGVAGRVTRRVPCSAQGEFG